MILNFLWFKGLEAFLCLNISSELRNILLTSKDNNKCVWTDCLLPVLRGLATPGLDFRCNRHYAQRYRRHKLSAVLAWIVSINSVGAHSSLPFATLYRHFKVLQQGINLAKGFITFTTTCYAVEGIDRLARLPFSWHGSADMRACLSNCTNCFIWWK